MGMMANTIKRVVGRDGVQYRALPSVPFTLNRRTLTVNGRDYKVVELFIPKCHDGKPRMLITRAPYADLAVDGKPNYCYHAELIDDNPAFKDKALKKCIDLFTEHHTANP